MVWATQLSSSFSSTATIFWAHCRTIGQYIGTRSCLVVWRWRFSGPWASHGINWSDSKALRSLSWELQCGSGDLYIRKVNKRWKGSIVLKRKYRRGIITCLLLAKLVNYRNTRRIYLVLNNIILISYLYIIFLLSSYYNRISSTTYLELLASLIKELFFIIITY